jgi:hypothetical protein
MSTRIPYRILSIMVLLVMGLPVLAQDGVERYEAPPLGIAFDLPAGWEVAVGDNKLLAASPAELSTVQSGGAPQALIVRITLGTFNQLGITDATELPLLLDRLVPRGATVPDAQPANWGNGSGYQMLVMLPDEALTTRVGLLAVAGGRVAIVRGIAPSALWNSGASDQFAALAASLEFFPPQRDDSTLERVISNDGGVMWHYQEPQPDSGRVVNAGGITYDMFDVMYMTAGPGGVLALQMPTGARISYMGPWYDGNFVDVAIGPDTKLYTANIAADTTDAVMVVDRAGNYTRGWGTRGDGPGQFAPGMPQTIAVTRGGDVWTVSEGHSSGVQNRLYRFDSFGNLLQTIDLATINPDLSGVRIDNNVGTGALYLVGQTGNLNVIDANGEPLVVNLAQDVLADLEPIDIAIAPNNSIILALAAPGLEGFGFLELSVAGNLLDVFGLPHDADRGGAFAPGEYRLPAGLIIGPDGTGYWTETHPDTGYTQLQAFSFSGDGNLPLGVEMADDPGADDAVPPELDPAFGGGSLVLGQTVAGSLNNRYPAHQWTFEARAGDHVIITMQDASGTGALDPQLVLNAPDGREIAANDDVGDVRPDAMGKRDARIDFVLPDDGVYTIDATRFGGRGDYALTLELVD